MGLAVARGLASRLRLKHYSFTLTRTTLNCRQGPGISVEIETLQLGYLSGDDIRRQGPGISVEIETLMGTADPGARLLVARGLASRLRLKLAFSAVWRATLSRRQGPGISVEIETYRIHTT